MGLHEENEATKENGESEAEEKGEKERTNNDSFIDWLLY